MPSPIPGWANITGLHLAVWGLLVTVGGFTITLFQLSETRTSFEAAQAAVDKWKRQRTKMQIADSIRDAMPLLRTCLQFVGNDWVEFKSSYDQVRLLIAMILSTKHELNDAEKLYLEKTQSLITDVCSQLDDQVAQGNVNLVIVELTVKIRELQNFFVGLEQAIKERSDEQD